MRELLAFYEPMGLDRAAVDCVSRVAAEAWSSDGDHIAVRRADTRVLLTWLDRAARQRRLEVPKLAISDEQYDRLVGRHVRDVRLASGLSQAELAAAVGTGLGWVVGIERGRPRPSVRMVRRLAAELVVPVGSLLTEWPEVTP
ncbi:MAG TPA: helix-turn-helix domain-containing protein [Mycobacteriales bacterium]|nr:helix-turn-helix domain-containing protein [Mycobacteriales bacterium]